MDAEDDDEVTIKVPVDFEFYLRNRVDPIQIHRIVFPVSRDTFEGQPEDDLEAFVDFCLQSILAVIDVRGEERFVFTDERQNKFIVKTSEIQSISVLAPDASTIQDLLDASE